ncbi:MAG: hypothetical protein LBU12_00080 [Deltaproteobacteria bacterium]|jgi:chromosome segregation ATPase|nr:hypothetical protein [Deltaproteobacteria bacterium]
MSFFSDMDVEPDDGLEPSDRPSDGRPTDDAWSLSGQAASADLGRFLTGRRGLDVQAFLALAREIGKALSTFKPPLDFRPAPFPPDPPLNADLAKAMGAATLADFFAQTPVAGLVAHWQPQINFPRGPASIKPALTALNQEQAACERLARREPARGDRRKAQILAEKTALFRARDLFAQLRELADEWPVEVRGRLQEARSLSDAARLLFQLQSSGEDDGYDGSDLVLTDLATGLNERLREQRRAFEGRLKWRREILAFHEEIETYLAAAGREEGRGWAAAVKKVALKAEDFERRHRELSARTAEAASRLEASLDELARAERLLAGSGPSAVRERAEILLGHVEALRRSVLNRRAELAECWRATPSLVGRPAFLDKIYVFSAVNLGRAHILLEELVGSLGRFAGCMSNTRTLRGAAKEALAVQDRPSDFPALLLRARRRVAALAGLIAQRAKTDRLQAELEEVRRRDAGLSEALESREAENRRLAERLEALAAEGQGAEEADLLRRQLQAVEAERGRLDEELAAVRARLNDAGRLKASLIKSAVRTKRELDEASAEKTELESSLKAVNDELGVVKRRHSTLAARAARDQKLLKEVSARLKAQAQGGLDADRATFDASLAQAREERSRLTTLVHQSKVAIESLVADRRKLAAIQEELSAQLDAVKAREATLNVELAGREEELKEAVRVRDQLAEMTAAQRTFIDRLTAAYVALKSSWSRRGVSLAESESERDGLRVKLDKQKRALVDLATKRQQVLAELGESAKRVEELAGERESLLAEIAKIREEAGGREERERRLTEELEALKQGADPELKPLVQLLGLCLWRSQAQIKAVQSAADERLGRERQAGEAREAGLRIAAAAKEIDYLELLSTRDKELSEAEAQRDALKAELEALKSDEDAKNEDLIKRSWLCQQLSLALAAAGLKSERLQRGLKDFRRRMSVQRDEAQQIKTELEELVKSQSQALADHKGWLAELVPLVGFFLDSGRELWTGKGREDVRDAVLFFMRKENAEMGEEIERLKSERQSLTAERRGYLELHERMRARLAELQPLTAAMVTKFVESAAALAAAQNERADLLRQIAELKSALPEIKLAVAENLQAGGEPAESPAAGASPAAVTALTAKLNKARRALTIQTQQTSEQTAAAQLAHSDLRLARLENERLTKTLAEVEASLRRQEADVVLAKGEVGRAVQERDRYRAELEKKMGELDDVHARLKAASEAPTPTDGRLEAAWAAMTYLSSRAGDAVNGLQTRLDKQARDLEEAYNELQSREERIKTLEKRQDSLSLLYWTMMSLAAEALTLTPQDEAELLAMEAAPPAAPPVPEPAGAASSDEATDQAAAETSPGDADRALDQASAPADQVSAAPEGQAASPAEPPAEGKGGGLLSGSFLSDLRKAARRSLFSLFLTGGLVLFLPDGLQASGPIELGGPDAPMIVDPGATAPVSVAGHVVRWPSRYVGRTLDVSFLSPDERARGPEGIEAAVKAAVEAQARRWNLPPDAWVRLIQRVNGPRSTVLLSGYAGREAPSRLIVPHMPRLAQVLVVAKLAPELATNFLLAVDGFKDGEGLYWDRLFVKFKDMLGDDREALRALAQHLARRPSRALHVEPEWGGRLSPFLDFEKMNLAGAVAFLAEHVRTSWGQAPFKRRLPGHGEPERLAADLIFTAKLYRFPRTLAAVLAQEAFDSRGVWPATMEVYAWGGEIVDLIVFGSLLWDRSRPPLCDLDMLSGGLRTERPSSVEKKRLLLGASLRRWLTLRPDLLSQASAIAADSTDFEDSGLAAGAAAKA